MKELRVFFPKPGDLERLFWLKQQVDPMSIFDGMGTIPACQ